MPLKQYKSTMIVFSDWKEKNENFISVREIFPVFFYGTTIFLRRKKAIGQGYNILKDDLLNYSRASISLPVQPFIKQSQSLTIMA